MKVITKILQAVSFLLSLFLLWAGLASLLDVCNSARLMGWSSFIPSIVAGLVFIVMLICEAWLGLRINKLDGRPPTFNSRRNGRPCCFRLWLSLAEPLATLAGPSGPLCHRFS